MCFKKCVIEETSANSRIKNINLRNVEIQDNTGIVKYLSEKKIMIKLKYSGIDLKKKLN